MVITLQSLENEVIVVSTHQTVIKRLINLQVYTSVTQTDSSLVFFAILFVPN